MKKGGVILILFGLFWSGMTLLFDGFIIRTAIKQLQATRFVTTEGRVLSSEVTHHDSDDGATHGVRISYAYTVGDHEYTGDRYRFDKFKSSDSAWAREAVREHPVGSPTTVYYNPANPAEAVLRPGLTGSDLFLALFITPFNAVMLGFWWAGGLLLLRRWCKPVAGGVKLRVELRQTRARLTEYSPLVSVIASTAVLAFLSMFIVAFGFGGFHPSMRVMTLTWTLVLGGGLLLGGWHWKNILAGKYDLILDELNSTLQLPLTHGRKTRRTLTFKEVHEAFVDTVAKTDSDGDTSYRHFPALRLGSTNGPVEKLTEWHDGDRAREFVVWLNERLGTHPAAPATEPPAPQPIRLRPEP